MSKINYILILLGGIVALYAQAEESQNQYLLIGGLFILMVGLYRLSSGLSSKRHQKDNYIESEDEVEKDITQE